MNQIPAVSLPAHAHLPSGGRLVPTSGRVLPLRGSSLTADAKGGVARVVLEQRFENPHAEPLAVTYRLPLPADGAVSGFSFRIGDTRTVGEIDRKQAARERYEQALTQGRSAALLEQDRSSLFTQEIGNVPPGETLVVEVIIDQKLRWLDEGCWEWRFPTTVAPRYLGEAGRVSDAAKVTQEIADGPIAARVKVDLRVRDALGKGASLESPSHAFTVTAEEGGARGVLRETAGVKLDRDVVLRWAVSSPKVGVSLDAGRPRAGKGRGGRAYGLLTLVPPSAEARVESVSRDLIVLLDTSGSMDGEPLSQARRVVSALVSSLGDRDHLELVEFSDQARRWSRGATPATAKARSEALAWLGKIKASGSTEMRAAIVEALSGLRAEAQRQVVLVTDGQIGFESEVVAAVSAGLPSGSCLHTVGVGSAVNRSLLGPAARAGRGVEVILGLGEDPERAAARILSRTRAPLVVGLEVTGSAVVATAPQKLPDLFAGAPSLVSVELNAEGGEVLVSGRTASGTWERRLTVGALDEGAGSSVPATLFGREAVEDLETSLAGGASRAKVDAAIEELGVAFQIATRLTSWVAVTKESTVDPDDGLRRETMPHELAHGLSAMGLGLRAPAAIAMLSDVDAGGALEDGGLDYLEERAPAAEYASLEITPLSLAEAMAKRPGLYQRLGGLAGAPAAKDSEEAGAGEPRSTMAPAAAAPEPVPQGSISGAPPKPRKAKLAERESSKGESRAQAPALAPKKTRKWKVAAVMALLGLIALAIAWLLGKR